jgi:hypothetical protein
MFCILFFHLPQSEKELTSLVSTVVASKCAKVVAGAGSVKSSAGHLQARKLLELRLSIPLFWKLFSLVELFSHMITEIVEKIESYC